MLPSLFALDAQRIIFFSHFKVHLVDWFLIRISLGIGHSRPIFSDMWYVFLNMYVYVYLFIFIFIILGKYLQMIILTFIIVPCFREFLILLRYICFIFLSYL